MFSSGHVRAIRDPIRHMPRPSNWIRNALFPWSQLLLDWSRKNGVDESLGNSDARSAPGGCDRVLFSRSQSGQPGEAGNNPGGRGSQRVSLARDQGVGRHSETAWPLSCPLMRRRPPPGWSNGPFILRCPLSKPRTVTFAVRGPSPPAVAGQPPLPDTERSRASAHRVSV